MRVQLEEQSLRLRVDEAELARLLAGGTAENRTQLPDGRLETQQLKLAPHLGWRRDEGTWQIELPETDVRALSERLPSREGLRFELPSHNGNALQLMFDVDVRDSARKRVQKSKDGDGA